MPQSLVNNLVHLVWSTKNRQRFIEKSNTQPLESYTAATFNRAGATAIQAGAAENHLHALVSVPRTKALKTIVAEVKRTTSTWGKEHLHDWFYWQSGYAGFSVSASMKGDVVEYIARQWKHHQSMSFGEELKVLLDRYEIDYDEEYLLS